MNTSSRYQWLMSSVNMMPVMLPSRPNSVNTVTVERRPVYWKYTESARLEASAMALVTTNSHFSPLWKPGRSFRCIGSSISARYSELT